MRPGLVSTLSDVADEHPEMLEAYELHVDGVHDVFGITAVDPNGLGLLVVAMLPDRTKLKGRERETWKMLGAHLAAGHRLRRAIAHPQAGPDRERDEVSSDLPHHAEAILDPARQLVTDAFGVAREPEAAAGLREAAVQIDRARGSSRASESEWIVH